MRRTDVHENRYYLRGYGGRETIVKITHTALCRPCGPWWGINLRTGRRIKITSAGHLRREVSALEVKLYTNSWWKHRDASELIE